MSAIHKYWSKIRNRRNDKNSVLSSSSSRVDNEIVGKFHLCKKLCSNHHYINLEILCKDQVSEMWVNQALELLT